MISTDCACRMTLIVASHTFLLYRVDDSRFPQNMHWHGYTQVVVGSGPVNICCSVLPAPKEPWWRALWVPIILFCAFFVKSYIGWFVLCCFFCLEDDSSAPEWHATWLTHSWHSKRVQKKDLWQLLADIRALAGKYHVSVHVKFMCTSTGCARANGSRLIFWLPMEAALTFWIITLDTICHVSAVESFWDVDGSRQRSGAQ